MNSQTDISKLSEDSKKKLQLATESKQTISDIVKIAKGWIPETEAQILSRGDKPELSLKRMAKLNYKLWGIHKGKMTVIAARTGQAKSVMAANIAWDLATQGKRVYFISLEMSVHQILERMFSAEASVNNYELLTGKMSHSEYITKQWEKFKIKCDTLPLLMSDMMGRTWKEVDEVITALGKKPDIVIIDHLQEISSKGIDKLSAIEEYLNHMREMAVRNNFALVVCSQINRMGQADKDRRPQLHQLKGSGAIEEKADIVILLHWEYSYKDDAEKNLLEVHIAKNRTGATGCIDVKFIPEYSRLEDYGEQILNSKPDVSSRILGERCEESIGPNSNDERGNPKHIDKPEDIVWEE